MEKRKGFDMMMLTITVVILLIVFIALALITNNSLASSKRSPTEADIKYGGMLMVPGLFFLRRKKGIGLSRDLIVMIFFLVIICVVSFFLWKTFKTDILHIAAGIGQGGFAG